MIQSVNSQQFSTTFSQAAARGRGSKGRQSQREGGRGKKSSSAYYRSQLADKQLSLSHLAAEEREADVRLMRAGASMCKSERERALGGMEVISVTWPAKNGQELLRRQWGLSLPRKFSLPRSHSPSLFLRASITLFRGRVGTASFLCHYQTIWSATVSGSRASIFSLFPRGFSFVYVWRMGLKGPRSFLEVVVKFSMGRL